MTARPQSRRTHRAGPATDRQAPGARKNEKIPLFFPGPGAAGLAAMQRGNGHCYMESSFRRPGVYKPPAMPSPAGAAQGAHYPAGTRGDIIHIEAVTRRGSESEAAASVGLGLPGRSNGHGAAVNPAGRDLKSPSPSPSHGRPGTVTALGGSAQCRATVTASGSDGA